MHYSKSSNFNKCLYRHLPPLFMKEKLNIKRIQILIVLIQIYFQFNSVNIIIFNYFFNYLFFSGKQFHLLFCLKYNVHISQFIKFKFDK